MKIKKLFGKQCRQLLKINQAAILQGQDHSLRIC